MITIANNELPNFLQSPMNMGTGRPYKGGNVTALKDAAVEKGYTSPDWGTMKQWNVLKESVRKNEKGTPITYQDKNGPQVAFVFNRCQLVE